MFRFALPVAILAASWLPCFADASGAEPSGRQTIASGRRGQRNVDKSRPAEESGTSGILFSESFDDADLPARGWYDGTKFKISAKNTRAGKGCIEYHWNKRSSKAAGSAGVRHLFRPTDCVYVRFYIRLSPGWGWSKRPYHPHLTHFLTSENGKYHGPAASHLTLYIEPVAGKLRLAATDIQNKDAPHGLTQGPLRGGYNGKLYDSKEVLFDDDKWHCVEAMFKLNSLDLDNDKPNADGQLRGWLDGKLVIEHTNVVFRSTDFPRMKMNQFLLTPYFGPGLLPHAQTLWIDELAVGTKRIGPIKVKHVGSRDLGSPTLPIAASRRVAAREETPRIVQAP